MTSDDGTGDGQPEPCAPSFAIARTLKAIERRKHRLPLIDRYSRAIVVNDNFHRLVDLSHIYPRLAAVARCIHDEVIKRPLQREVSTPQNDLAFRRERHGEAEVAQIVANALKNGIEFDVPDDIASLIALEELEGGIDHHQHLVEVGIDIPAQVSALDVFDAKLGPSERRLEIMGDRRQLTNPDGVLIDVSSGEYDLLLAFLEAPQRVLTREQLLDMARNRTAVPGFDRSIDVQISRLRRKMGSEDTEGIIKTVRGAGYMFVANVTRL